MKLVKLLFLSALITLLGIAINSNNAHAGDGDPVTAITVVETPAVPFSSETTPGGVTQTFGNGVNRSLVGFNIGASAYQQLIGVPSIVARRVDNVHATGILNNLMMGGIPTGVGFNADMQSQKFPDVDTVINSNFLNNGILDTFTNDVTPGGNPFNLRPGNVERIDVMYGGSTLTLPSVAADLGKICTLITEKNGNNPFFLAVVTAVDGAGNPSAYSGYASVDATDYQLHPSTTNGGVDYSNMYLADVDTSGTPLGYYEVWSTHDTQDHGISCVPLTAYAGLTPGQQIYGYSIFPHDINTATLDAVGLTNTTVTPGDSGDMYSAFGIFTTLDINIEANNEIGIAKSVASPITDNNDGTFTANYTLFIENTGDGSLFDIQVTDDLTGGFGAHNAGTLTAGQYQVSAAPAIQNVSAGSTITAANGSFNGSTDQNLITINAADELEDGDSFEITFSITFYPDLANAALDLENEAVASGDAAQDGTADGDATDDSTNGTDPDANGDVPANDGDGDPNNTDSPTPVTVPTAPVIGAAKAVTGPVVNNFDGTFTADFTVTVENTGNVDLYDLQVTDDLATQFGSLNTGTLAAGDYQISTAPAIQNVGTNSTVAAANAAFNGDTDQNLLTVTAGDRLAVGESYEITFEVTFFPNLPASITNRAVASGDTTQNGTADGDATDNSTDGVDPDPENDGPGDNDTPTPVPVAAVEIGVAKTVATPITDNNDGTFTADYTILVENTGDLPMFDIQVTDDITAGFGAHNPGTLTAGQYQVSTAPAIQNVGGTSTITAGNATFNGDSDQDLMDLTAGDSLAVGESYEITFSITFYPDLANTGLDLENEVDASGDAVQDGTPDGHATDDSTNGTDVDAGGDIPGNDGDGNPTNTDSPTPVTVPTAPVIGAAKDVTEPITNNFDGTFTADFIVTVENTGNVDLYDLQVTDDLTATFGSLNTGTLAAGDYQISTAPAIQNVGTNSTVSAANAAFNGDTDQNLLTVTAGDRLAVGESYEITFEITFFPDFSGPYSNAAIASGDTTQNGAADGDATDTSHDGTDPDPENNGPGDNDTPTPVPVIVLEIAAAKNVATPITDNNDGTFTANYTILIENTGDADLRDIQVTDDLATGFGTQNPGTLTAGQYQVSTAPAIQNVGGTSTVASANAAFDGSGDQNLLSLTTGDILTVGESFEITFSITFYPDLANTGLDYENEVDASGDLTEDGVADGNATDDSTNGTDVDAGGDIPGNDGDGDPTNTDSPTPVTIPTAPQIGAAKTTVNPATNNFDGTFTSDFTILVENTGNVDLYDLQVTDDLTATFGSLNTGTLAAGDFQVSTAPAIQNVGTNSTVSAANAAFNGDTDQNLLTVTAGDRLAVGESYEITFSITFFPDFAGPYSNAAIASGDETENSAADGDATDTSHDGTDVDPENDGPGDNSTPTPVVPLLLELGVAKDVATPITDNNDGTFTADYTILVENTGDAALRDIQVTDDLTAGFGTLNTGALSAGEYQVSTVPAIQNVGGTSTISTANAAFDGNATQELLVLTAGDILEVGESFEITFSITFYPDLNSALDYENEADASGDLVENGTADGNAVDDSTNGTDPDDNGTNPGDDNDGEPNNTDSPTPVTIPIAPEVGIAKTDVPTATDNNDGTFTVDYTLLIENSGNVDLYDLQVTDSLTADFGVLNTGTLVSGEYQISNAPALQNVGTNSTITAANAAFDGDADTNLLTLTAGDTLVVGETFEITFSVMFYPDLNNTALGNDNRAIAFGDQTEDGAIDTDPASATPADAIDNSTNGTDPDAGGDVAANDGNDDPTDTDSPTPVIVPIAPQIGLAKTDVPTATDNGDGTFTVDYTLLVENTGNVNLFDIQVTDDLTAGFGTHNAGTLATGEYQISTAPALQNIGAGSTISAVNAAFDGSGDQNLMTITAGDVLVVGDTFEITFSVDFYPDFNNTALDYENEAIAFADQTEDGAVDTDPASVTPADAIDNSANGTDPDAGGDIPANDNDDDPTNTDSPTPVTIPIMPEIGVAKETLNTPVTDNRDATFTVDYLITVENTGNVDLFDIQITDDLTAGFGTHNPGVLSLGQYQVSTAPAIQNVGTLSTIASGNAAFNGSSNQNLLALTPGNKLSVGEGFEITVSVTFYPDLNNAALDYENEVLAFADQTEDGTIDTDPASATPADAIDNSVNGTDVDDGDADGNPTNNTSPTPLVLPPVVMPELGLAKAVTGPAVYNGDGTFTVEFLLTVDNADNVPLYDLQITDDLTPGFGTLNAAGPLVLGQYQVSTPPAIASIDSGSSLTTNPAFDGSTDQDILTLTPGDTLAFDESATITFSVTFMPDLTNVGIIYNNSAVTTGDLIDDGVIQADAIDDSVNGTDVNDGDGDGDPTNNTSPTPVTVPTDPIIGVAKDAVEPITIFTDGTGRYTVDYTIVVQNYGNVPLYDLQVTDDLTPGFGVHNAGTLSDGEYQISTAPAVGNLTNVNPALPSVAPVANAAYDGSGDQNLLAPGAEVLMIGDSFEITFSVTFKPDWSNTALDFSNQAEGSGDETQDGTPDGDTTDLSQDGPNPDPDGDGDPTNNNEPTIIEVPVPKLLITKQSNRKSASIGDVVVWTITVENQDATFQAPTPPADIVDTLPLGFRYVAGTATVDGVQQEPSVSGNQLTWSVGQIAYQQKITIIIATRIAPSVKVGKATNLAQAVMTLAPRALSDTAQATVEIIPEHVFDCGEVIGQVFDDKDLDGYQDDGEKGIPGVQLYTLRGLKITTDKHGRYHIPCAMVPNHQRGSNFTVKLDTDTLPTGYRMTSENPRTVRLTRGKVTKANFGANISRVVSLTLGDKLFDACTPYVKRATEQDLIKLLPKLLEEQSVVRVSYYAINASQELAEERLENFVDILDHIWEDVAGEPYRLEIEEELIHDASQSIGCDANAPELVIERPEVPKKTIYRQFRVYFRHDKHDLTPTAVNILEDVKAYISKRGYDRISLEGHADKSGNIDYNNALAKKRNVRVQKWLQNQVSGLSFSNSSFGENKSPVPTPDGVKEIGNRVVFITIEHDKPLD